MVVLRSEADFSDPDLSRERRWLALYLLVHLVDEHGRMGTAYRRVLRRAERVPGHWAEGRSLDAVRVEVTRWVGVHAQADCTPPWERIADLVRDAVHPRLAREVTATARYLHCLATGEANDALRHRPHWLDPEVADITTAMIGGPVWARKHGLTESGAPVPDASPVEDPPVEPEAVEAAGPGTSLPEPRLPESAVPAISAPKPAAPKSALPKAALPKSAVPKSAVPKSVRPEAVVLEAGQSETAVVESAPPGTAEPATAVSPKTAVRKPAARKPAVAKAVVLETAPPKPAVPGTAAPKTAAPKAAVPEAPSPKIALPETPLVEAALIEAPLVETPVGDRVDPEWSAYELLWSVVRVHREAQARIAELEDQVRRLNEENTRLSGDVTNWLGDYRPNIPDRPDIPDQQRRTRTRAARPVTDRHLALEDPAQAFTYPLPAELPEPRSTAG